MPGIRYKSPLRSIVLFYPSCGRGLIFLSVLLFPLCAGCTTSRMIQSEINALAVSQRYDVALDMLQSEPSSYGTNNKLLYYLDYGLVAQYDEQYRKSIKAFETAKRVYDQLYTRSLSKQASTWVLNDTFDSYRAEDYERVMMNIFQALNFLVLGDFEEALVEARDVDSKLSVINRQYRSKHKNVYSEDAFARLLVGILYESSYQMNDLNDAYIAYKKAFRVYNEQYQHQYRVSSPRILQENLLSLSALFEPKEHRQLVKEFRQADDIPLSRKQQNGEIYVFHYHGLSPLKHPIEIPIPLPDGLWTKLSFPRYIQRSPRGRSNEIRLVKSDRHRFISRTELVQDMTQIAIQQLENRRVRDVAKAVLRIGSKYYVEKMQLKKMEDKYGGNAALAFQNMSSLFNFLSEQADLRSWMTLPAEIWLGRMIVPEGEYQLYFNGEFIRRVSVQKGRKYFYIHRTIYDGRD
ncbi:MAG: hypothetical protein K8S27_08440 [Candidatus Omnitrophica bacterium]|nr:hypothetical protein [Candidatus Omnitrophota bacterium]